MHFLEYENISIVTRSHPDAFPSPLKDKRSVVQSLSQNRDLQNEMGKMQEIDEKCPDCGQ
jgi:DNA-directed RNA polymerase I subunit RPA12